MRYIVISFLLLFSIGSLTGQSLEMIDSGDLVDFENAISKSSELDVYYRYKKHEYTLLCYAIKRDKLDIVKLLIEKGADIEKMSNGKTPLMYAAKYGLLDIVEVLLEAGADIDMKNTKGRTAKDYARKYAQREIYRYLKSLKE